MPKVVLLVTGANASPEVVPRAIGQEVRETTFSLGLSLKDQGAQ